MAKTWRADGSELGAWSFRSVTSVVDLTCENYVAVVNSFLKAIFSIGFMSVRARKEIYVWRGLVPALMHISRDLFSNSSK